MNKRFKMLCLFIFTLVLFLSACSSSETTRMDEEQDQDNQSKNDEITEEVTELNVAFYIHGERPRDLSLVQEKINEITLEKLNVTVNLMPIASGNYQQQMNLIMSGNEKLDLAVSSGRMGFSTWSSNGQLLDLNDLLDEYGEDIKDVMDENVLYAPTINGNLYGIPTKRDLAGQIGFNMRADLVEKHGIDLNNINTLEDVESVLRTIKDNEPGMEPLIYAFAPSLPLTNAFVWFDSLGDYFGILPNDTDDYQLVNLFETPGYEEFVQRKRRWYNEGLILSDATTTSDSRAALLNSNIGFGYFGPLKPGIDSQNSRQIGMPMVSAALTDTMTYTLHPTAVMWSIPRNTTAPEKAMQLLNLMYVDEELVNLLNWGIEGKHYVKVDDNIITYPDGVDASRVGYSINMEYLWGNSFLTYIMEGEDPNLWEEMEKYNESAVQSKALGFIFDPSPVRSELTALNNVRNEFAVGLEMGVMDPERYLPEFIQRLRDAGIDRYIEEKQRQFDEFLEMNN